MPKDFTMDDVEAFLAPETTTAPSFTMDDVASFLSAKSPASDAIAKQEKAQAAADSIPDKPEVDRLLPAVRSKAMELADNPGLRSADVLLTTAGKDIASTLVRGGSYALKPLEWAGISNASSKADRAADEINQQADIYTQAHSLRNREDLASPRLADALTSGGRSVIEMLPMSLLGGGLISQGAKTLGTLAPAAIGGAIQANQSITEGRKAGLSGAELGLYAASQGAAETLFEYLPLLKNRGMTAALMREMTQKVAESTGFKAAAKEFGKDYLAEHGSEIATSLTQAALSAASGVDPNALTLESLGDTIFKTVVATSFMSGTAGGPTLIRGAHESASAAIDQNLAPLDTIGTQAPAVSKHDAILGLFQQMGLPPEAAQRGAALAMQRPDVPLESILPFVLQKHEDGHLADPSTIDGLAPATVPLEAVAAAMGEQGLPTMPTTPEQLAADTGTDGTGERTARQAPDIEAQPGEAVAADPKSLLAAFAKQTGIDPKALEAKVAEIAPDAVETPPEPETVKPSMSTPEVSDKPSESVPDETVHPLVQDLTGHLRANDIPGHAAQGTAEAFIPAFEAKDVKAVSSMLHTGNKNLRAWFEKRTGIKLPNTEGGTKKAIQAWAAPAQPEIQQKPQLVINRMSSDELAAQLFASTEKKPGELNTLAIEMLIHRLENNPDQAAGMVGNPVGPFAGAYLPVIDAAKKHADQDAKGLADALRRILNSRKNQPSIAPVKVEPPAPPQDKQPLPVPSEAEILAMLQEVAAEEQEAPAVSWKKAKIIPTREGIKTEPIVEPPAPAPRSSIGQATERAATQAEADLAAAMKELGDVLRSQGLGANVPLNPQVMVATAKVTGMLLKVGVTKFADAMVRLGETLGATMASNVRPYLAKTWNRLRKDYPQLDITDEGSESNPDTVSQEAQSPKTKQQYSLAMDILNEYLQKGRAISEEELFSLADKTYGGTRAEGKYGPSEVYDALEVAINKATILVARVSAAHPIDMAKEDLNRIQSLLDLIPRQKNRSGTKDQYQQFSTPADYAFAAAWVANIGNNDIMLEDSAGTGCLLTAALTANPTRAYANELEPGRAALLQKSFGMHLSGPVFTEDAAQVSKILPGKMPRPTVMVINPPFSNAANRNMKQTGLDRSHVDEGLMFLEDGGRMVAIMGAPMIGNEESAGFDRWISGLKKQYTVRANLWLDRGVYAKYGTTFPTRIMVIDKVGPQQGVETLTGKVDSIESMMDTMVGVHDARKPAQPSGSAEPDAVGASLLEGADAVGSGVVPGSTLQRPDIAPSKGAGSTGGTVETGTPGPIRDGGVAVPSEPGAGASTPGGRKPRRRNPNAAGGKPADGGVGSPSQNVDENGRGTGPEAAGGNQVSVETNTEENKAESPISDSAFEAYKPARVRIPGAQPHPGSLVESAAMAAVPPPAPKYNPRLPKDVIEKGILSDVQLENVIYAGQAHSEMLQPTAPGEPPMRRGYFIGDGTGVGKGRQIAGIILDNFNQGRRKALWISENKRLRLDATRDWTALGQDGEAIFDLGKTAIGSTVKAGKGIMFTTYDTLSSSNKNDTEHRIDQIVSWLGADFDGVIAFDEAHKMKSALSMRGSRGMTDVSKAAAAAADLQAKLPNARVVYVSATGATEVSNLGYASRLGIWGPGTAFADAMDFVSKISAGGVAAMEQVAKDLKAMGMYLARSISFNDGTPQGTVQVERMEHALTENQTQMYDKLSEAWQTVLQNINVALQMVAGVGGNGQPKINPRQRANAIGQFWGSHQRFFNQIITAMQTPSVLSGIEKDLADGKSIVVQLTNTNEAEQERKIAKMQEGDSIGDLDLTPRETLMQLVDACFPTQQNEVVVDDSGKEVSRPVLDSSGNPVQNPEAVALKNKLMDEVGSISVPESPIDMILNKFGTQNVAEVTGRKRRKVMKNGEYELEKRGSTANASEISSFQDGKKRVLIFSEAGGTGASYHADRTKNNQQPRVHYLLQAGWKADKAIQGLGRTHRTNQASAPIYRLVTTNLKGQKRFISTIARRLDQLGALTRGQRQAGAGIFTAADNLESTESRDALHRFYFLLAAGRIEGITIGQFMQETGLQLLDRDSGGLRRDLPPISQFLNRLLSMNVETQNKVFGAFEDVVQSVVEQAKANGTLDSGMETIRAAGIKKLSEQIVHTDERSGATTKYVQVEMKYKVTPITWKDVMADRSRLGDRSFFIKSKKGTVYLASPAPAATKDDGRVEERVRLKGQLQSQTHYGPAAAIENEKQWTKVSDHDAEGLWEGALASVPKVRTETNDLVTGLLLPVWDRLPEGTAQLWRMQTDDGERILGRMILPEELDRTLERLGAKANGPQVTSEHWKELLNGDIQRIELSNGWTVKRSNVSHEDRIELVGVDYAHRAGLVNEGAFEERIDFKTRIFLPTNDKGWEVLGGILKNNPATRIVRPGNEIGGVARGLQAQPIPRIQPNPLTPAGEKSPSEMVLDFGADIGKRVHQGTLRPKNLGEYHPRSGAVALRHPGDLSTLAHEIAHYLDDKHGILTGALGMRSGIFDKELRPFWLGVVKDHWKLDTKREEGLAEWVRAWILNPDEAKRLAPRFYAHVMATVSPADMKILRDNGDKIRAWSGLSPVDRAATNIRMDLKKRSIAQRLHKWIYGEDSGFSTTAAMELEQEMTDDMAPVWYAYDWIKEHRNIGTILPEKDIRILFRLMAGREGRLGQVLENGMVDGRNNRLPGKVGAFSTLTESFDHSSPEALKLDMRDTMVLMLAERTIEKATQAGHDFRNLSGIGAGITEDWSVAVDAIAQLKEDEVRYEYLQEGAKAYRDFSDSLLRLMVETGRKTQEEVDRIRKANVFYLDMHRVMDDTDAGWTGNTAVGRVGDVLKKFKGSTRVVENPYLNLIHQAEKVIGECDRNHAMRSFVDLLEVDRDMRQGNPPDLDSVGRRVAAGTTDALRVFRNGEAEYWKFEKGVNEALTGWMKAPDTSLLWKAMELPAQLLRWGVIYSPQFMIRNAIRDTVNRGIVSNVGSTVSDIFRPGDKANWELFGGSQAGNYMTAGRDYRRAMERNIKKVAGGNDGILSIPGRLKDGYVNLAQKSEEVNRLAEFGAAYRYAKDTLKYDDYNANLYAAFESRSLLDYAVAGRMMRKLNRIEAFLNPSIQGLRRAMQSVRKSPGRTAMMWAIYAVVPALAALAWNAVAGSDDDKDRLARYRALPSWKRDMFLNFWMGKDIGWLSIPRPFEFGALAGIVERSVSAALGENRAFEGFAGSLFKAMSPFDESTVAGPFKAMIEHWTNRNLFTQNNIVPPWEEKLDVRLREGTKNASRIGKLLQSVVGVDARVADNYMQGTFGNLGRMATTASNVGREDKNRTVTDWLSVFSGVFTAPQTYSNRNVQKALDQSRSLGLDSGSQMYRLRSLLKKAEAAQTTAERSDLSNQINQEALKVREWLDKQDIDAIQEIRGAPRGRPAKAKSSVADFFGPKKRGKQPVF